MGLFSKALGGAQSNISWTSQKAVLVIVIGAIKADGDVSDSEVSRLRSMLARSPLFADNTSSEDDRLIDFADGIINQLGQKGIETASEALNTELRETAFAFACEMLLADGLVGSSEEEFIESLATTLGIDASTAEAVILTTVIRMRS